MSLELLNNPFSGNFKDLDKPWENENFQDKFPELPRKSENTTRRKGFEEISFERKFGEENKCIETNLGKFFSGQMRIDELIHDLYDNQNNDNFFFNFGNYAMNYGFALNNENPDMMLTLIKNASADFSRSIKYKYIDNHNYTREADVSVELNLMPCFVDITQPGFEYILDPSSESIKFCIKYVYSNYLGKRIFDESKKVYTIETDYNAIIISSKKGDDFLAIVNDNFKNPVKTKIIENFVNQLQATTSFEGLKFLYENMPSFVLKELKTYLPNETLWQHLITLTRYDYKGYLSVFKDASGALIKLLRAFKDSKFLYDKFKADQTLIKTIFNNLDDISEIDGEITTNKLAFASFLSALCLYNGMEGLRTLDKTFISNQDYIFNSSDNLPRDEKGNEFYLQQLKKAIIKSTEIIPDDLPRMVERMPIETTEFLPIERGDYYHPLDIVFLKDSTEENAIAMPVAAILIKAIADERERIERQRAIRIGFDILAIVLGVITVATTANPGVLALAIADIALSSGDIAVQSAAPELQKTKEGQEFLEAWENIYLVGGIITAGPVLIENIFTLGGKLFLAAKAVKNFKVMNFVKACLIKIILERNIANFGKNTIKVIDSDVDIVFATRGYLNAFKMGKLYQKSCFLISKSTTDTQEEINLIYKGKIIAKGNKDSFYKQIKNVAKNYYKEEKLVEGLEEMEDNVWKYFDREPASGNHYETKDLENIYKFGSKADFEKGVKYLTEKEREAYEVFVQHNKIVDAKGNLVDTNGSISILPSGKPLDTEYAIFVMSEEGKIYLSKNYAYGKFHHSSFLSGKPISAGGEIYIEKGVIKEVTNDSGHYIPSLDFVKKNTLKELEARHYFNIENTKEKIIFKSNY